MVFWFGIKGGLGLAWLCVWIIMDFLSKEIYFIEQKVGGGKVISNCNAAASVPKPPLQNFHCLRPPHTPDLFDIDVYVIHVAQFRIANPCRRVQALPVEDEIDLFVGFNLVCPAEGTEDAGHQGRLLRMSVSLFHDA